MKTILNALKRAIGRNVIGIHFHHFPGSIARTVYDVQDGAAHAGRLHQREREAQPAPLREIYGRTVQGDYCHYLACLEYC